MLDKNKFLACTGSDLGEYVDQIGPFMPNAIDAPVVRDLLGQLHSMDFMHAFYVLSWALQYNEPGLGVYLGPMISRDDVDGGAQVSLLQLANDIPDLTKEQVLNLYKVDYKAPMDLIGKYLLRLTAAVK